jgi:hypothetical protein
MAGADIRITARWTANDSRRPGVSSCDADRDRRLPWRRSLRRTRRAIDSSLRLVDSCQCVIDGSERSADGHPLRANRQLQHAAGWLTEAAAQLQRAVHGLRDIANAAAHSPERAADAPGRLIDATARWLDGGARIAALSERLEDVSARLVDAVKAGVVSIDPSEPVRDSVEAASAWRLIPSCRSLKTLRAHVSCRNHYISVWCQQPHRIIVAEVATEIFRGRAPPARLDLRALIIAS